MDCDGDQAAAEENLANGVREAALAARHRKPEDVPGNRECQEENDSGHEYSVRERCMSVVQLGLKSLIGTLLRNLHSDLKKYNREISDADWRPS